MITLKELKQTEESELMAVYVVPWPKNCGRCQMPCRLVDEYILNSILSFNDFKGKPDGCPLRMLPERKDNGEMVGYTIGEPITEELADRLIAFGFNECLDEITGEVEE